MGLDRAVIFDRWRNQRRRTAIGNNRTVVFYTACIALIFRLFLRVNLPCAISLSDRFKVEATKPPTLT